MRKLYRRLRPLLGTFVEVGTYDDLAHFEEAVAAAFATIERVHKTLSFHDPESELSKLNASQGQWIKLSPLSIVALRLARSMSCASEELFNCTVGGALVSEGKLPRHFDSEFLTSGSYKDLELRGTSARLQRPVLITLDGIAKGYAVDLAVKAMKSLGVTSGYVNAGGDLRVFGELILPLHRREIDESLTTLGNFQEIAVATSTVSEQYNPQYPGKILGSNNVPAHIGAWTVTSGSAWRADALTKVASLASDDQRQDLITRLGGKLLTSKGLD
ncbi:FAD:protein FMN transferase [Bdellovibrio svalbardensis]|uniref:FAD:protein FMN transferase n=1 Tax=Bdellovibrio svalbardensis TaxID=2972972 RepID=A0ABT6DQ44_9BACT|nr:FAD:protein FMN transferase [Bdellovibrio svalbardensis]MDG0818180.1 FAD:protein FMN transferase [Bdellovibrio svalbardensis]